MSTDNNIKILRDQADKLGLEYHHKHGAEALRAMVGAHLLENPARAGLLLADGDTLHIPKSAEQDSLPPAKPNLEYKPINGDEYKRTSQKEARRNVGALRRIRFTNMNPTKKNWPGEFISVGSAKLGSYKKYVFFNGEDYHVPQIIYDVMKERQCSVFYTVKTRGGEIRRSKLINEYAIVDLPPLTQKELKDLADRQQLQQAGL